MKRISAYLALRRTTVVCVVLFFFLGLLYSGGLFYSKSFEQKRLRHLQVKSEILHRSLKTTSEAAVDLMREVSLGEQVVSALQSKTSGQAGQIRFLIDAIREKSSIPNVNISLLNEKGEFLWGASKQGKIDPSVLRLGIYGEERLFARQEGSFFHHLYLEGISPIVKQGGVTGLVHLEIPLTNQMLQDFKESVGEEIFLFGKDQLQSSSVIDESGDSLKEKYLSLLKNDAVQSRIKTAFLELSANRTQKEQINLTPRASICVVPLRGMGGEVVAMMVVLIPEKGLYPYFDSVLKVLYYSLWLLALFMILRLVIFFALKITTLKPRFTVFLFLGVVALLGLVFVGTKGLEAYFGRNLYKQNEEAVRTVSQIFREYDRYILNSIGDERETMKRQFIRFLRGEPVNKPSQYEFIQIPLGLKKEPVARVTLSHVPIRWSGTGIFSQKAKEPFAPEAGIYKVPIGRYAQKLWLVYSSAWGYPNKYGSPYGTSIGTVQVHFENGNFLAIDLKNGVNIHDRFSPLEEETPLKAESKKAFEFISEEDPLTRLQYVEEMEFSIPKIYADSKIDYVLFEDKGSPDVPLFYAVTLGVKKVPALPSKMRTIDELETELKLKKEVLSKLNDVSLVYYQGDQIVDFDFKGSSQYALIGTKASEEVLQTVLTKGKSLYKKTSYFGFPSVVTYWPVREKSFEKPWGMLAVVTPAYSLETLAQISEVIQAVLFVFILILGVVVLGNFIISWRKLRFKLVSYSFLVSFVPLFLVVSLLGYLMWQREEETARSRVAASLEQTSTFLTDAQKRVEDVALLLGDRESLLEAVQKGEDERISRFLNEVRISALADYPGGFIVVKLNRGVLKTQQWSTFNYPALPYGTKRLLENDRSGFFVNQVASLVLGRSQVALAESSQDPNTQGRLSVLVGIPIDQEFLTAMKRRIGTDFAFYSADALRLTTLKIDDVRMVNQLKDLAKSQFASLMKEGKNRFDTVRLEQSGDKSSFFRRTAVGAMPLKDESNRVVGMIASFSTYSKTLLTAFSAQKVFIFSAIFILALAWLMSFIISRSITKPISALAKRADLIAQGKLGTVIRVGARDEIGNLAQSFNHMSSSLKENQNRLEQKISDLLTLQQLSSKVSSVLEKEELMHLIVKLFSEMVGFHRGLLLIKDPNSNHFMVESTFGVKKSELEKLSFLPEETLAGLSVKERSMIFVKDHLRDQRVTRESLHHRSHEKPMMILSIPLLAKGKELGAVVLEQGAEKEEEVRVDEVLMMTLANHAAIALENAHLYEMAVEDGLTKVFVNRYFQFRLTEEVEHSKRYKTALSLVLIDLDSFKPVNDNYGHQVGDKILIEASKMMKKTFRSSDVVCRYGGDEFAVILPKTKGEEAMLIAERLRKEVEKLDFAVNPNIILRVTLSIGIATWDPSMDKEAFIKAADTALYAAKTGGRNRVARFEETA